jgi:hypothetical protein
LWRYRRLLCKYFEKYIAEDISITQAVKLARSTVAWIVYYENIYNEPATLTRNLLRKRTDSAVGTIATSMSLSPSLIPRRPGNALQTSDGNSTT